MPRLPDNEVESYLRRAGLSSAEVDEVMTLYGLAVGTQGGAGAWDREESLAFLNAEIEARNRRPPAGDPSGPGGTASIVEASRRTGEQLAQRRRRLEGERTGPAVTFDQGPAVDPDELANAMALGQVDAGGIWEAIKGQTFNMGSLGMPGVEERRQRGYRPVRRGFTGTEPGSGGAGGAAQVVGQQIGAMFGAETATPRSRAERRYMTPSQAIALLGSMDEDYLVSLQQQLVDSGLYAQAAGDGSPVPSWGVADEVTRRAFIALFAEASLTPEQTLTRVLARLTDENQRRKGLTGDGAAEVPAFQPQVPSATTIRKLVDDMSQALRGKFASDEEKAKLTEIVQQGFIGEQRAKYDADLASAGVGGVAGGTLSDLEAFKSAISGVESGGDYGALGPEVPGQGRAVGRFQIMPANWAPWAERAGLGRNAPQTPENQERVASVIMSDYYRSFGNWRDVAIAWFAGPGAVGKANAESRSDGNLTVRQYADRIVNAMARYRGQPIGTPGTLPAVEQFDPEAEVEAALKAMDPAGWAGHAFAGEATEFFGLLGGVGRGPLSA